MMVAESSQLLGREAVKGLKLFLAHRMGLISQVWLRVLGFLLSKSAAQKNCILLYNKSIPD
ncbi:MAG: hypothetical protein EB089_09025, partial [Acidimicrobiia bacterium]|nr:hypothetical protein [Acidimicrobiia bacterium]